MLTVLRRSERNFSVSASPAQPTLSHALMNWKFTTPAALTWRWQAQGQKQRRRAYFPIPTFIVSNISMTENTATVIAGFPMSEAKDGSRWNLPGRWKSIAQSGAETASNNFPTVWPLIIGSKPDL